MEELNIQTHGFEDAKNQLKTFSEETETKIEIRRVESKKEVGQFWLDIVLGRGIEDDHMVKGVELNEFAADVQKYLIDINNLQKDFIKQFGTVYTALEALDKDYIQAILVSVKSAEKAYGKAKNVRKDIEQSIEEQHKIIKILEKFKIKLDKNEHLDDIDQLWQDSLDMNNAIKSLREKVDLCQSKYDELLNALSTKENEQKLKELISNNNNTLKNKLRDIDFKYSKKIKIAYSLAGGAIILSLIEFVLMISGVI